MEGSTRGLISLFSVTVFLRNQLYPGVGLQQILHSGESERERDIGRDSTYVYVCLRIYFFINTTYCPCESVVEPSLPMMRYCLPCSSCALHWRLLANTLTEFSSTVVSLAAWHRTYIHCNKIKAPPHEHTSHTLLLVLAFSMCVLWVLTCF